MSVRRRSKEIWEIELTVIYKVTVNYLWCLVSIRTNWLFINLFFFRLSKQSFEDRLKIFIFFHFVDIYRVITDIEQSLIDKTFMLTRFILEIGSHYSNAVLQESSH